MLSEDPCVLNHAVLWRHRFGLRAAALRSEVKLQCGRLQRLRSGDWIEIQCHRLRYERVSGNAGWRNLVVVLVILIVSFGSAYWIPWSRQGGMPSPSLTVPVEVSGPSVVDGRTDDQPPSMSLERVRELMREGRRIEARLELLSFLDQAPDDTDASALLAIIDQQPENAPVPEDPAMRATQIRQLTEEVERFIQAQQVVLAREKLTTFVQEHASISAQGGLPLLIQRVDQAFRAHLEKELRRIEQELQTVHSPDIAVRVQRFATLAQSLHELLRVAPDSLQAQALFERVQRRMTAEMRGWLAGVEAIVRYQGCAQAMGPLRRLTSVIEPIDATTAEAAKRLIASCESWD